jgi:hypothetical protein
VVHPALVSPAAVAVRDEPHHWRSPLHTSERGVAWPTARQSCGGLLRRARADSPVPLKQSEVRLQSSWTTTTTPVVVRRTNHATACAEEGSASAPGHRRRLQRMLWAPRQRHVRTRGRRHAPTEECGHSRRCVPFGPAAGGVRDGPLHRQQRNRRLLTKECVAVGFLGPVPPVAKRAMCGRWARSVSQSVIALILRVVDESACPRLGLDDPHGDW